MCEPATALGVASFASGAASAVGGYQQAQAQAAAQNRAIANRANQRNRQFELDTLQGIAGYQTEKIDVERKQDAVSMAVRRNISEEQLKRQDRDDRLKLALTEMASKRMLATKANEGGRARSSNKNQLLALGRAEGALYSNKKREDIAAFRRNRESVRQGNARRQELFASVANPYRPGPAPSQDIEFVKGPSKLGLIANVGQAAVQGYSTYDSLLPPD